MPNGHGGVPRYWGTFFWTVVLLALLWLRTSHAASWTFYAALPIAALLGRSFAWHRHLYPVMEYGGGYTPADELARARRRFRWLAIPCVALALLAVTALWP